MADVILTAERLREVVHYEPSTGKFIRKVRLAQRHQVGDDACHPMSNGYLRVGIDSERYLAHRLAWLYVYGEWPDGEIDHINGNRADNRIANLRVGTHAQNMQNRRNAQAGSSHGVMGVYFHKQNRKWVAAVTVMKKTHYAGFYDTPEEAHQAYLRAKRRLHEFCAI